MKQKKKTKKTLGLLRGAHIETGAFSGKENNHLFFQRPSLSMAPWCTPGNIRREHPQKTSMRTWSRAPGSIFIPGRCLCAASSCSAAMWRQTSFPSARWQDRDGVPESEGARTSAVVCARAQRLFSSGLFQKQEKANVRLQLNEWTADVGWISAAQSPALFFLCTCLCFSLQLPLFLAQLLIIVFKPLRCYFHYYLFMPSFSHVLSSVWCYSILHRSARLQLSI